MSGICDKGHLFDNKECEHCQKETSVMCASCRKEYSEDDLHEVTGTTTLSKHTMTVKVCDDCDPQNVKTELCVCDIFTPMAWDDEDNSCAECGGVKKINYYDNVNAINKSLNAIDGILDDAKENDPEFYDELKEILNT